MRRRTGPLAFVAAALLALVACAPPPDGRTLGPPLDALPIGTWSLVPLTGPDAGGARCADGSPYAAQVRRGDPDHLVVVFQGGGATWGEIEGASALLRPLLGALYVPEVTSVDDAGIASPPTGHELAAATQVVVSYCSGDVHWGDAVGVDAAGEAVTHRGAANVRAVLAWLDAQRLTPARLDVLGCSAGSYGALLWAPSLRERYPHAARSLLLDAGLGLVRPPFVEGPVGLASWNTAGAYRDNGFGDLVGDADVAYFERLVERLAVGYGGPIGISTTDRDLVQAAFWSLTGDEPESLADAVDAWSQGALERLERLAGLTSVSTFVSSWVPSSAPFALPSLATGHCFVSDDDLWRDGVGAEFRSWWAALRSGSVPGPVDVRDD